jgi:hypothetical protein
MLVGLLASFLVGAVLMSAMQSTVTARETVNEQNESQTNVRQPIDLMADHLRNAQLTTATPEKAVSAASATSVTYYTDSAGSQVTYFLSGSNLMRTEGDATMSPSTVLTGVTSLQFTYYKIATYNAAGFAPCSSPSAPTTAELPRLSAVQIDATVAQDGFTATYSTLVRLRNSPKKTRL